MKKDWLFQDEETVCNVRVAGVLLRDGKLLVQRDKNGAEYALPGGHVQMGEETKDALKREIYEETGARITAKRLLWTEECFWKWGKRQAHTFTFYYQMEGDIPDTGFAPQRDNENVVYGYLALEDLKEQTVYPAFIKQEIFVLQDAPKHFVTRD